MNIFVLDDSPVLAAEYHCDKHVVKMIVETAQLLSNAHWKNGSEGVYMPSHINHPASEWVSINLGNYAWLVSLGLSLCIEYSRRFLKRHKTQDVIEELAFRIPNIPDEPQTRFIRCMPEEFKVEDPILSYRNYYLKAKKHFAEWNYSSVPPWWKPDSSPSVVTEKIKLPWEK